MKELHLPTGLQTSRTPLAEVLERQDRAISTAQLHACGLSQKVITRLSRDGWLHHKHQGVWIVGTPKLTPLGAIWAAHLATGGTVSHRSSAVLRGMRSSYWKAEVIVPHHKRSRDLILVHQGKIDPADVEDLDGLPVTRVERTLLDLADVLTPRQLEIAINQADVNDALDYRRLESLLLDANGRRGVTPLRHALEAHALGHTLTRSELEEKFLELVRGLGFTQPETRKLVLGFETDFCWPERRVIIETDGARFHRFLRNREDDAHRDRTHRRAGWTVDRLTHRQVFFRPDEVELILEETGVPRVAARRRRPRARRRRRAA